MLLGSLFVLIGGTTPCIAALWCVCVCVPLGWVYGVVRWSVVVFVSTAPHIAALWGGFPKGIL